MTLSTNDEALYNADSITLFAMGECSSFSSFSTLSQYQRQYRRLFGSLNGSLAEKYYISISCNILETYHLLE